VPHKYSDRARRCSGIVTLAMITHGSDAVGRWMAIRLSDGGSDEVLYDTKKAAIDHQLHEQQCAYVSLQPDGMSARAAELFLRFNEGLYDAGYRLADPDTTLHTPVRTENAARIVRAIKRVNKR
jgi:hypothetical protein